MHFFHDSDSDSWGNLKFDSDSDSCGYLEFDSDSLQNPSTPYDSDSATQVFSLKVAVLADSLSTDIGLLMQKAERPLFHQIHSEITLNLE